MGYPDDNQYEDVRLKAVEANPKGSWTVEREDGWSFLVPAGPVTPEAGSIARLYGRGIGYPFRGLFIDGAEVFYRTEEEEREYQDIQAYGRDAADILTRWDKGDSVWSVKMGGIGPGYEQAIQLTVFEILRHFLDAKPDASGWVDGVGWKEARDDAGEAVDRVIAPLGLSGAQWGAALSLASALYRDGPRKVHADTLEDRHIQVSKHFPSLGVS